MSQPTAAWPGLDVLRSFAAKRPHRAADHVCDLCSASIAETHGHLADVTQRSLLCVCRACYLLFLHDGSGGARFRAVPDRYVRVDAIDADVWDRLDLPIGLAFFLADANGHVAAFYPSPGGATESTLPLGAWDDVRRLAPTLQTLVPDVEALLVRREPTADGPARTIAFIVPIDVCYELVGRVRREWRGFQGGETVWAEVDTFFHALSDRT